MPTTDAALPAGSASASIAAGAAAPLPSDSTTVGKPPGAAAAAGDASDAQAMGGSSAAAAVAWPSRTDSGDCCHARPPRRDRAPATGRAGHISNRQSTTGSSVMARPAAQEIRGSGGAAGQKTRTAAAGHGGRCFCPLFLPVKLRRRGAFPKKNKTQGV